MFDEIKVFRYFPWLKIVMPVMIMVCILTLVVTGVPKRPRQSKESEELPVKVEIGELKKKRTLEDFKDAKLVA